MLNVLLNLYILGVFYIFVLCGLFFMKFSKVCSFKYKHCINFTTKITFILQTLTTITNTQKCILHCLLFLLLLFSDKTKLSTDLFVLVVSFYSVL